ncbi:LytTR family transcriptional regulator DNA-binding domain-containing protein [Fibrella aquatica]|uniref:LytTR family transcriptional regulator DNA-binding domain-containing protein n=1 Tax=Fibrella aquatica TaxID=3242487 RepID=UPI0035220EF0
MAGANNYTWLHFRNGEKKMLAKPISYLETQLTDFVRVHKTALVNPICVENLNQPPRQRMAGTVELEGGILLPVSRRRWNEVAAALRPYLSPDKSSQPIATETTHAVADLPKGKAEQSTVARPVILVTEEANTQSIKWGIESRWSEYTLHNSHQSSHLPRVLSLLSTDELPALVILDARTSTLERLNTLQQLKEHDHFGQIPIVMIVPPADDTISVSYQRRANSVISLPDAQTPLAPTIDRICQFWLRTAVLPQPA